MGGGVIALLAVCFLPAAVALLLAHKDERARQGRVGSTSAHLAHEGATRRPGSCSAECSRPASAHRREGLAGCTRRAL